ncbi:MAG: trypsin-like peptidase domain-containing protein [Phycisphaerales bacterium]|nr:trypsin-like peptidase domain-containing protein [Phycisphaerales bacterium]
MTVRNLSRVSACFAAMALIGQTFAADLASLVEQKAKALVRIRFVQKTTAPQGEREAEREIPGVMIDPTGIVVTSNTASGGINAFMKQLQIQTNVSQIKVFIGDDEEGLDADKMPHDSDRDLVWIKIREPGDRKFDFVDLSGAVEPKIGDELFTVSLMSKFYGLVPVVKIGQLGGMATKPRKLFIPTNMGEGQTELGAAVFARDGSVVGLLVLQMPDSDDATAMQEDIALLILPAADVAKATQRSREAAAAAPPAPVEEKPADEKPADATQP